MSLFTPQSVAIEDTQIEIELCTEREFTSIAEIQANKWHAQPTQTHMHTTRKSPIFSSLSYWMWSILCHIYSIKKKVSFYDIVVRLRIYRANMCACVRVSLCLLMCNDSWKISKRFVGSEIIIKKKCCVHRNAAHTAKAIRFYSHRHHHHYFTFWLRVHDTLSLSLAHSHSVLGSPW